MTLNELIKFQEDFDSKHESCFKWNSKITDNNIELLEFLMVCLTGEVGETANIIKKIVRGDFRLEEKKSQLQEEIIDIFIYLLKMSYQLNIDLEQTYFVKMKHNAERFKNYEQQGTQENISNQ